MNVNRYNFLRWDDGMPTLNQDFPNNYIKEKPCYKPTLLNGEAMIFYINVHEGLSNAIMAGTTLDLVKTNGDVTGNIAPLQTHTFTVSIAGVPTTKSTFYASVVVTGIPYGEYFFRITDGTNTLLTSNLFIVTDDIENTVLAKFRHNRYMAGVRYHELTDFYQQYRIHMNFIDWQLEVERSIYTEVTTGKQRTYNAVANKMIKAETYYFDDLAHEAAFFMFECKEVLINGNLVSYKSPYKINRDSTQALNKGEIELFDDNFATINRCN